MENTPPENAGKENSQPQTTGETPSESLLGKLKQKVSTLSADIKKNFHPCEICGASISTDTDRCPSCDEAYQDLTDPEKTPLMQDELIDLINRFARNAANMADGELKDTINANLERLRKKLKGLQQLEKEQQAEQKKLEEAASGVLHSNSSEIFGYDIIGHKDIVTASVTETLTPNNGPADTQDAFKQALKAADLAAIRLEANAIINLHISCTGIESMTLAPRILFTVTGTAVVVQKKA